MRIGSRRGFGVVRGSGHGGDGGWWVWWRGWWGGLLVRVRPGRGREGGDRFQIYRGGLFMFYELRGEVNGYQGEVFLGLGMEVLVSGGVRETRNLVCCKDDALCCYLRI